MFSLIISSLPDRDAAERVLGRCAQKELALHSFHFPAESGEGMVYVVGIFCRREDVEEVLAILEEEGSIKSMEVPLGLTR